MNYHSYHSIDVVNGEGTRCTLFVSGCEHRCKGCYNQSTWRLDSGYPYTIALEEQIIADLNDTRVKRKGLSLSGGDPLHPSNIDTILALVKRVKAECPGKDIWVWTGYVLDALSEQQKAVIEYLDVLIDGKFEQALYDPDLKWRGSSNQVIHRFSACRGGHKAKSYRR
ncbi:MULTISPECIES: anaerobic ribonucleoside-triphosphate reductase-activating protein [unclassified Vibrio]|uniref:Anaerobic ribonucleoside-triphosphate reductase-activating protein n=1 Tax=Vibrio sp. HB236076 TaxID=3232307 RepID=A0AB39HEI4_9VIBR|nr:anaerobic ribonucleoside-triphosphate reductase-activating protein [Vibrio sp. HB161653]MDP5252964.1 anaerobic ribonucleoside-triphosphate reductase-activating protein [Vibrio sp. HB161653]